MVNIKSFCFTDGYTKVEAVITIPSQVPDGFKLTKVIIGTQKVYNTETDDFDLSKDATRPYSYHVEFDTYEGEGTIDPSDDTLIENHLNNDGEYVFRLNIDENNIKVSDLFFIKTIDNIGDLDNSNLPCSLINPYTWATTYDNFSIDSKGIQYIRQLANTCETPSGMIDYILNKEALDVAASCGDYSTMIDRYDEVMNFNYNSSPSSTSSNNYKICGCNG